MHYEIKLILTSYIHHVDTLCQELLEGLNQQENLHLKTKWDFFTYIKNTNRTEFLIKDRYFRLHGKGCFAWNREFFLTWDFGYRSRWCGIDPWMVGMTLRKNKSRDGKFYDGRELKEACEQAVAEGEMFCRYGLYYFTIPEEETFSPDFPDEFDALMIEYFDKRWIVLRDKRIDKFLRKSRRVANQIYEMKHTCILHFLQGNQEIYTIPYHDVCYPEHAVKIMSDAILWRLLEEEKRDGYS